MKNNQGLLTAALFLLAMVLGLATYLLTADDNPLTGYERARVERVKIMQEVGR